MFILTTHFRDSDVDNLLRALRSAVSVAINFEQQRPPKRVHDATWFEGKDSESMWESLREGGPGDLNICVIGSGPPVTGTYPWRYLLHPKKDGVAVNGQMADKGVNSVTMGYGLWVGNAIIDGSGCVGIKDGTRPPPMAFPVFGCPREEKEKEQPRDTCPGDGLSDGKSTWASSLGGPVAYPFRSQQSPTQ